MLKYTASVYCDELECKKCDSGDDMRRFHDETERLAHIISKRCDHHITTHVGA